MEASFIHCILASWYESNKRDLPWRGINDPYKIWVSEIILQQTRVKQGIPYYLRFIDRFPNVFALASAQEKEVLMIWQGLGYYSRARNMHATAQAIVSNYEGQFPTDYFVLCSLKGIGKYTAAAITSFAWDKPFPVLDGNVFRFLSRFFGIDDPIDTEKGKQVFKEMADALIDKSNPALFNQAIMEFGALQCVPDSPDCYVCPLSVRCVAWIEKKSGYLPR